MFTKNCVAAVISATPSVLKPWVEEIQQMGMPIAEDFLAKFQYIEVDSNFALFVYYQANGDWFDEWQMVWDELEKCARAQKIAYYLQRFGNDFNDVDHRLSVGNYHDSRLLTLFDFNRKIVPNALLKAHLQKTYIAAVIAGLPEKLHAWMKQIQEANHSELTLFLHQFQFVKISSDFAVLVFYYQNLNWYSEMCNRWEALSDSAHANGLTYYLRRFGHLFRDVHGHNSPMSDCDSRLFQLFEINREIVPNNWLVSLLK